ncbi:MAG: RDD family protein [Acidobacteria bacterium]|nr:MAG: RDD family protein [Acidobacteriota bacterium]
MKCPKCGFVELAEESTCRYCGSPLERSILIPFPKTKENATAAETTESQTDWRAELRERIREIQARRKLNSPKEKEALSEKNKPTPEVELPRASNEILEAALNRIRRGGHAEAVNAPSASPAMEEEAEHRPLPSEQLKPGEGPSLVTGRVRPEMDNARGAVHRPSPPSDQAARSMPPVRQSSDARKVLRSSAEISPAHWSTSAVTVDVEDVETPPLPSAGEDEPGVGDSPPESHSAVKEPLGSLLVDTKATEFELQTATALQRLRSGIVDILVLLLANIPFVALIELSHGDFGDMKLQSVVGGIALLLFLFYVTLMLAATGQTIGMMSAGIVAVDARTRDVPSPGQALRRALGALLAAIPAFLGFAFPVLDPQGRSVSDMISGTELKRAFDDRPRVQLPWLYHHGRPS